MMWHSRIGRSSRALAVCTVLVTALGTALVAACNGQRDTAPRIDAARLQQLPTQDLIALPHQSLQVSGLLDHALTIRGGVLLDDGSVALGVAGQHRVLLFAPDGTLRDSIGRSGAGPGEFRTISRVFRADDGLGVFDAIARRVTWIRMGRVVGVTALQPGGDAIGVAPQVIGALGMWRAVVITRFTAPPQPGTSHDTLAVGVVDSLGHITLTGARVRGADQYVGDPKDGSRALGMSPFGRGSVFSVCGSHVLWSPNDTIDVRRLRSDAASAEPVVRIALPATPIYDARLSTLLLHVTNDGIQKPDPESVRMLRAMMTTTELPQLEAMHCARTGAITLQRFMDPLADTYQLIQLDASGAPTRTFTVPNASRLIDITANAALVSSTEGDDTPVVRVIKLRP